MVKIVVVEAVRKVGILRSLQDFQAEWEPRFWGFPRSGFSTAFSAGRSFFEKDRVRIV